MNRRLRHRPRAVPSARTSSPSAAIATEPDTRIPCKTKGKQPQKPRYPPPEATGKQKGNKGDCISGDGAIVIGGAILDCQPGNKGTWILRTVEAAGHISKLLVMVFHNVTGRAFSPGHRHPFTIPPPSVRPTLIADIATLLQRLATIADEENGLRIVLCSHLRARDKEFRFSGSVVL